MANKRCKPEEVAQKLRKVDVRVGLGMARVDAMREVRNEPLSAIGPRPMDGGPAFVAMDVRAWITAAGARTAFIEPGSPGRTATSRASTPGSGTSC